MEYAPGIVSGDIQAELRETLEREKKKYSLVVVGHKEVDTDATHSAGDKKYVLDMCDKLGIVSNDVVDVFRSGQARKELDSQGREYSRVMKVKFANSVSRRKFLFGFRKQLPVVSKEFVRPDMTYNERKADKLLQEQLKQRRKDFPNGDFIIRNGAIINRPAPNSTVETGANTSENQ